MHNNKIIFNYKLIYYKNLLVLNLFNKLNYEKLYNLKLILIVFTKILIFFNVFLLIMCGDILAERKKAREVDALFGITFRIKQNSVYQNIGVFETTGYTKDTCNYNNINDSNTTCSSTTDNKTRRIDNTNSGLNTPPSTTSIPISITFPKKIIGKEFFTQVAFSFENLEYVDLAPDIGLETKIKKIDSERPYNEYDNLYGIIYDRRLNIDAVYGDKSIVENCLSNNIYSKINGRSDHNNSSLRKNSYTLNGFKDQMNQINLPCEISYDLRTQLIGFGIMFGWVGWMSGNTYHRWLSSSLGAEFYYSKVKGEVYFCQYYEAKRDVVISESGDKSVELKGKCIGRSKIDEISFENTGAGVALNIKVYEYEGDGNSIDILGLTLHQFNLKTTNKTLLENKEVDSGISIMELSLLNWTTWF